MSVHVYSASDPGHDAMDSRNNDGASFQIPRAAAPVRRLAGYLLDAILINALALVIFAQFARPPVSVRTLLSQEDATSLAAYAIIYTLCGIPAALACVTVMTALCGQTVGKAIVGIRVVRMDGRDPVGFRTALMRHAGMIVSGLPFLYGFARIFIAKDRRALHDLLAGTRVVSQRPDWSLGLPFVVQSALAIAGLSWLAIVPGRIELTTIAGTRLPSTFWLLQLLAACVTIALPSGLMFANVLSAAGIRIAFRRLAGGCAAGLLLLLAYALSLSFIGVKLFGDDSIGSWSLGWIVFQGNLKSVLYCGVCVAIVLMVVRTADQGRAVVFWLTVVGTTFWWIGSSLWLLSFVGWFY